MRGSFIVPSVCSVNETLVVHRWLMLFTSIYLIEAQTCWTAADGQSNLLALSAMIVEHRWFIAEPLASCPAHSLVIVGLSS